MLGLLQKLSGCHKLHDKGKEKRDLTMAKLSKANARLYCGTIERVVKLAPFVGVNPGSEPVYLSDVYPGLFAFFASTNGSDRFGIIEIETEFLDSSNFLTCEWFLEQSSRQKSKSAKELHRRLESYRKVLEKYHDKWRESLQKVGVCLYDGYIAKKTIRRITVYDPASNPTITNAIVNARISFAVYKSYFHRNQPGTRWLTARPATAE